MLNTNEVYAQTQALVYPGSTNREAYAEYKAAQQALENEWKLWLEDEYASQLPSALLEELYTQAWSEGHSSGYSEIENWYRTFAEFAEKVRAALCFIPSA
jgi:flagellar biosynthesis/type III secretory pathway protein FliH